MDGVPPIRPSIAAAFAGSARQRCTMRPRLRAAPRYGAHLQSCRQEELNENCCSTVVCCGCSVSLCFFFACRTSPDYARHTSSFETLERCEHFIGTQR